jgi:hypothetical protein
MRQSELHFFEDNIGGALSTIDILNFLTEYAKRGKPLPPMAIREIARAIGNQKRIIARNQTRMNIRKHNGGIEA